MLWRRTKDGAQIPAEAFLADGFMVLMQGRGYDVTDTPDSFRLLRGYRPLIRAFMRASRRATWKHLDGNEGQTSILGDLTAKCQTRSDCVRGFMILSDPQRAVLASCAGSDN